MISYRQADLFDQLKIRPEIGMNISYVPFARSRIDPDMNKIISIEGDVITTRSHGNIASDHKWSLKTLTPNGIRNGYFFIFNDNGTPFEGKDLIIDDKGSVGKITSVRNGTFYTDRGMQINSEHYSYTSSSESKIYLTLVE